MNLREQFEDGLSKLQVELFKQREQLYWQAYSEWLEQRNKEQVEVLNDLIGLASDAIRAHGYDPTDDETIQKAEEQLNKSE